EALADEKVQESVAVVVEHRDAPRCEVGRTGAASGRDIGELAAAVVAKQRVRRAVMRLLVRLAVDGMMRQVQVQLAVVVEIRKHRPARSAQKLKLLLVVDLEFAFDVAKELMGFRSIWRAAEGADEQTRPAVAIHIAPANAVAGNAAH